MISFESDCSRTVEVEQEFLRCGAVRHNIGDFSGD